MFDNAIFHESIQVRKVIQEKIALEVTPSKNTHDVSLHRLNDGFANGKR